MPDTDTRSQPVIFISHGAPNIVLHNSEAKKFLQEHGQTMRRPRAILVVSAHFETGEPRITADPDPEMIYDFHGFESELYDMTFPAPGDPALAAEITDDLINAGFAADILGNRGYDHGTWVPLTLMTPDADIPVLQLSVQPAKRAEHHFRLGQALAGLRNRDILIIASGSLTHNLAEVFQPGGLRPVDDEEPKWVRDFADWVGGRIVAGDRQALISYRSEAPHAQRNHPTEEHFLPLLVALGAAGSNAVGKVIHSSHQFGVLRMDAYAWQ